MKTALETGSPILFQHIQKRKSSLSDAGISMGKILRVMLMLDY